MQRKRIHGKILAGLAHGPGTGLGWKELAARLGVRKSEHGVFRQVVQQLHRNGRLVVGEDKAIHLPAPGQRVIGTFQGHRRGFGFVSAIDPHLAEDLYVPAHATGGAVTGDLVEARVMRRRVRREMRRYGQVERIIARGRDRFVGTLVRAASQWLVETDGRVLHQPIIVGDVGAKGARAGDRVVVHLTEYPNEGRSPRGVVREVLGPAGEYDAELGAVIREFDLPDRFGTETECELDHVIERFNKTIQPALASGTMPRGRVDLRDGLVITIDPEDARDFDDAFSVRQTDSGYELGIYIADVAAFVRPRSALDREARERGNSVYLPRKVMPMLPEALSNGLCSLQQGQDRLVKSVLITYDAGGKVVGSRFANAVIRSKRRLTYKQATAVLEGHTTKIPADVVELLRNAQALARVIYRRREKHGMLHLDLPEVELEYNDDAEVIDAHPADQSFSHTIIEMFMVEANEAVAALLARYKIPFIRRIHPDPPNAAFDQLRELLALFGYKLPKKPALHDLQGLIASSADRPESFAVNLAILRSFEQAQYSIEPKGHYALASAEYCHFTSPIRRYPDLTVHRLLDDHLTGRLKRKSAKLRDHGGELQDLAQHTSFTERRAENAERQLTQTLILQLLSQHVGNRYKGLVTGVGGLGAFVQLRKFLIEGMISTEQLGSDGWEVNIDSGYIRARHSRKRIRIGEPLDVVVVTVDPVRRFLDLAPADPSLAGHQVRKTKRTAPQAKKRGRKKTKRRKR